MDQSSGSKRPAGVRGRGEVVDVVGADKQKVITDDAVLVQAQKKRSVTVDPSLEVAGTVQKVVGGPDDGLGMLVSKPPGKSGYGSLMGDSGVPSDGEDQRDKRKKTIRKHFTDIEQQTYDAMYTELLRKHVKLCSFDEIQNQLSAVIPERFTMEQKSALASSTYSNLAVQYSRIRKTQIKMLQSDHAATRWLDELGQNQMLDPMAKQKELDDRILEAAKYLAARTISKTSPYFRPTDEELERSRKLIKKWMNPTKRNELVTSLVKPKRGAEALNSSK